MLYFRNNLKFVCHLIIHIKIKKFSIAFLKVNLRNFKLKKEIETKRTVLSTSNFFKFMIIMMWKFMNYFKELFVHYVLKNIWNLVESSATTTSKTDDTALKVIFGNGDLPPYFFSLLLFHLFPKYQRYPA